MKRLGITSLLIVVALAGGCASTPEEAPAKAETPPATPPAGGSEQESPDFLERPFTAEHMRHEWVPGLTLKFRRATSEGEILERWTVVSADEDGAEIEYANLDPEGNVTEDPVVERSAWVELRDHATFPAATSRREKATRTTEIGTYIGWLYTVEKPEEGTVTELFFARQLPGPPTTVRTTRGEELVMELTQIERYRPE